MKQPRDKRGRFARKRKGTLFFDIMDIILSMILFTFIVGGFVYIGMAWMGLLR
jgi:hypothetical protein